MERRYISIRPSINPLKIYQQPKTVKNIMIIYWILQNLAQMHTKFFYFGKESNSKIERTSQLSQEFVYSQKALTITLPMIITTAASCQAISATMFIQGHKTRLISCFFSAKHSKTQLNWTFFKIEALPLTHFKTFLSPFIEESKSESKVFID